MTVTVLAPAYNEEDVIVPFVETMVQLLPADAELLVVDDGSADGTPALLAQLAARHPALRVVTHEQNRGLGAALATGFATASGEVIVTMDADLSHPTELLDALVGACGHADLVLASRYVPGGGMVGVPLWRAAISRVVNRLLATALRAPVRDLTTGYRAYRRDAVQGLTVRATRFDAQLEITVRLLAAGCSLAEVPLELHQRAAGESKMRYMRLIPRYGRTTAWALWARWRRT